MRVAVTERAVLWILPAPTKRLLLLTPTLAYRLSPFLSFHRRACVLSFAGVRRLQLG